MITLDVTRQVANFVMATDYDTLPSAAVDTAKKLILDQVGVQLACCRLPWNLKVHQYVVDAKAAGPSTVVGYGLMTSSEYAALANATFGHGFEIDDYHLEALSHPGCVAVPAALAVGQLVHAPGKEFIVAVALASEVIVRIGLAVMPSMLVDRGFHETCTLGTFGAAAASSKLLRLHEESTLYALGIAGSHSSGTTEYAQTGGDVKRLHAGLGAMGGIRSALLAANGFTSPPTILEGKRGFLQAFAQKYDVPRLVDQLGRRFEMVNIGFKAYCCCGCIHPQIDVLRHILNEHAIDPLDIKEVVVGTDRFSVVHVGTIGPEPKDIVGAQFSSHFSLGLTVVKGKNDFQTYVAAMDGGFREQSVLEVARRVKLTVDEECDAAFPRALMAKVTVRMRDGREYRATDYLKGSAQKPMSTKELEEKFLALATRTVAVHTAERLLDMIRNFEQVEDVREIATLLSRSALHT